MAGIYTLSEIFTAALFAGSNFAESAAHPRRNGKLISPPKRPVISLQQRNALAE
jgi:hypothetical protein